MFGQDSNYSCPLSFHQAQTCAEISQGKSRGHFQHFGNWRWKTLAYLPGLLNPGFRIMGLYPTIELVTDQEKQVRDYYKFDPDEFAQLDSLYGAEVSP